MIRRARSGSSSTQSHIDDFQVDDDVRVRVDNWDDEGYNEGFDNENDWINKDEEYYHQRQPRGGYRYQIPPPRQQRPVAAPQVRPRVPRGIDRDNGGVDSHF